MRCASTCCPRAVISSTSRPEVCRGELPPRFFQSRGDGDWSTPVISGHNEILEAIEAGLPDKAADAMRKHLLSSRRHFVDITT